MLNVNPTAAHHLVASLMVILTIYLMTTKYPQNGSSKGISTLLLVTGQQLRWSGKRSRAKFLPMKSPRTARCDRIPVSPLQCIAADPHSPSEAQMVPVRGFLQTAKTNWNSLWESWLPDFAWRQVRGVFNFCLVRQ